MDVAELLEKAEAIRLDEIDQARFEGRLETALSLLQDGFPIEMITKHTELPTSEILALQADFPPKP